MLGGVKLPAAPGDVLAVWTSGSLSSDLIRVGEALAGQPAVANHVAILTHQDKRGRWIGIQGQPGGVGLCDCTPWLADSRTRSNHAQPKPDDHGQLTALLASCARSLGVAYDWVGIAEDALGTVHAETLAGLIDSLWSWPGGGAKDLLPGTGGGSVVPGHVVCSSLAAMLYDLLAVGWAHPDLGAERRCMPSDWWDWSDRQAWRAAR